MRYYDRGGGNRRDAYRRAENGIMSDDMHRKMADIYDDRQNYKRKKTRTKLVIDDNTIYEIDLDCLECMEKNKDKTGIK